MYDDDYDYNGYPYDVVLPPTEGFSLRALPPILAVVISLALLIAWFFVLPKSPTAASSAPAPAQTIGDAAQPRILAPLFTAEVQHWASDIQNWADAWGLDPNLVATVMQIESCGDPQARSGVGAMGLFQVMPFHFKDQEDPYAPETNATRGMGYLAASLKDKNWDTRLGLAGYNGGIGGARQPESNWPAETIRYVKWGMGIYEDAKAGQSSSETLNAWLNAGGASLCRQAAQRLGLTP